jgi:hypothetical protein
MSSGGFGHLSKNDFMLSRSTASVWPDEAGGWVERTTGARASHPSLLTGMVFDETGERLTPTHAVKKGTRCRYYVSTSLITGAGRTRSSGRRIPAEAAGIGNLAERLACVQQRPAMQKARGVIQTKRIDEFTARRAALRKELLKVA